jgi:polyisoprenyl-phosphate glycosyltransferase
MSSCPGDERLVFCIPVFNDWRSVEALLRHLDRVLRDLEVVATVILVDDNSTEEHPMCLPFPLEAIAKVEVLRLLLNVGHQRAIALGLTYISRAHPGGAVVVMDGDGEDSPEGLPRLLEEYRACEGKRIIFAQRSERSEGLVFRLCYRFYQCLHRLLTGRRYEVGNFSIIPFPILDRLVGYSEIWNHYAAAVFKGGLPAGMVPVARARRLCGEPRMNLVSLIAHGLSAISVFREEVTVRLLLATGVISILALIGLAAVVSIRLFTRLAIPGWATSAAGILSIILLNALVLCLIYVIFLLQARNSATFIPARDYEYYVGPAIKIAEQPEKAAPGP